MDTLSADTIPSEATLTCLAPLPRPSRCPSLDEIHAEAYPAKPDAYPSMVTRPARATIPSRPRMKAVR